MPVFPISDNDIPYEMDIIRNPGDLDPWLRYLDSKKNAPLAEKVFVYERACTTFGRSYKLWKAYLSLRAHHIRYIDYKNHQDQFESVFELFEKSLILLNKMPRIWTDYLELMVRSLPDVTRIRHTFDRALQALPLTQHDRIWKLYLEFAANTPAKTQTLIWERYMQFDDSFLEQYIKVLTKCRAFEKAAEALIKAIDDPEFESAESKSRFHLWEDLIEILVYQRTRFDVDTIIRSAIARYTDQRGRLWVNLATYYINTRNHDKARDVFEEGMKSTMSIRDFTQIFDSYVEFEEAVISQILEEEENNAEGHSAEADIRMESFEQLMDRRPFIVNDILLKQDPNSVIEWEKRVGLWGDNPEQIVETYTKAIETIDPKKALNYNKLWTNFAKFYEERGDGDLTTARTIFDKATKVPFAKVDELSDVWIDWAEMELRHDNLDRAIKVLETAVMGPRKSTVNYFDETKSPQERLHKSIKLWSFYVDLVESTADLQAVKPLYDRIFELKIGTALTVLNYANLLEENQYFEDSFRAFERGLELFTYPVAFELWNVYLNRAVKRKLGLERLRDLFEQALRGCPDKFSKSIYLLYGKLEEDRGLISNALKIYDTAVKSVDDKSRLEMYQHYISRVADLRGLHATRPIFQQAVENLSDKDTNIVCDSFIDVEVKLEEIDRARAIFGFAAQFNNPDLNPNFWAKWESFEVDHGDEVTYKEMLRIKRATKAQLSRDVRQMADSMVSSLHREAHAAPGFVASSAPIQKAVQDQGHEQEVKVENPDEIDIDI